MTGDSLGIDKAARPRDRGGYEKQNRVGPRVAFRVEVHGKKRWGT